MIENDLVECVISLGKNLFYNSTMESCLLITNNNKLDKRKKKILFIDGRKELKKEKTISYLLPEHILKIFETFDKFESIDGFSFVADISEVIKKDANLNVPLYVKNTDEKITLNPSKAFNEWVASNEKLKKSLTQLLKTIKIKNGNRYK